MKAVWAGLFSLAATGADAAWLHDEQGGAFSDTPLQIAVGSSGPYGFGFRCHGSEDLEALFLTPERVSDEAAEMTSVIPMTLLVRVDDNEPHEIEAAGNVLDGKLGILAEVTPDLADEVEGAVRRVAVAVDMLGQTYHETEFDVRGSTAAVAALKAGCGLTSSETPGE